MEKVMRGSETGERGGARGIAGAMQRLRALPFWGDRRGVAAVEFAFIAPLLICMYFLSMEVSQAIETSKKVSRVGSMVADLVTQQPSISKTEVDAVLKIGEALLQPYNRTKATIVITGIQVTTDSTPKVLVSWTRRLDNCGSDPKCPVVETKGATTTVPDKLKVAGSFLIRVQSYLNYSPVITWTATNKTALGLTAAFDKINMGDTYYLRPRMSDTVPCNDC